MTNNCSPHTFNAGLKALFSMLGEDIRQLKFRSVMLFLGKIAALVFAVAMFLGCLLLVLVLFNALVMQLGFAKIYFFSLPIDISNESVWLSLSGEQHVGVTTRVFNEGFGVLLSLIALFFAGVGLYLGCKVICEMGRPKIEENVVDSETSSN